MPSENWLPALSAVPITFRAGFLNIQMPVEDKTDDNVEQEHCKKPQQNLTEWALTVMKSRPNLFFTCMFTSMAALLAVLVLPISQPVQAAPVSQSTCTLAPRLTIGGQGQVTPGQAN